MIKYFLALTCLLSAGVSGVSSNFLKIFHWKLFYSAKVCGQKERDHYPGQAVLLLLHHRLQRHLRGQEEKFYRLHTQHQRRSCCWGLWSSWSWTHSSPAQCQGLCKYYAITDKTPQMIHCFTGNYKISLLSFEGKWHDVWTADSGKVRSRSSMFNLLTAWVWRWFLWTAPARFPWTCWMIRQWQLGGWSWRTELSLSLMTDSCLVLSSSSCFSQVNSPTSSMPSLEPLPLAGVWRWTILKKLTESWLLSTLEVCFIYLTKHENTLTTTVVGREC